MFEPSFVALPKQVRTARRPSPRRPHATGLTLALVVLFSAGLSVAPLPEVLRPFPRLSAEPRQTALAAVWPSRSKPREAPPEPTLPVVVAEPTPEGPPAPPDELLLEPSVDDVERALLSLPEREQAEARQLEALARAVGAGHVDIEEGCRLEGPDGCEERALRPFFAALAELKSGLRQTPVRLVHLGNSLIASDYITGKARDRLQARHGSGGGGFFFVDRPTPNAGLTTRTGRATEGWEIERLTDKTRTAVMGLTGVAFSAGDETLSTSFDVHGSRLADVLYLRQPGGGALDVRADGRLVAQVSTREHSVATDVLRVALPEDARSLSVSTRGRVGLYGVATEGPRAGLVYDAIGIPGATAEVFLRANEDAFAAQLRVRDPALVVVMLGGNEALNKSLNLTTPEKVTQQFGALIDRVRAGAPAAACLLVSPLAAAVRTLDGDFTARAGTAEIGEAIRSAALEKGCAYWDMFRSFGGDEAFEKWFAKGLMQEDLVHPRQLGGDLLGHLLDFALTRAQLAQAQPVALPPVKRGQPIDAARLSRVFERLAALEAGGGERVAMLQLGASHTAAHFFSDEVRRRLSARFGEGGRGYVAAGAASRRLEPSGVRRSLLGPWAVRDAREKRPADGGVVDPLWGLTGVRAEGQRTARLEFTFCTRCLETDVTSRLQLFYVSDDDMGGAEVRLDGKPVARLAAPDGGAPRGVGVLELEAPGAMQRLEVRNDGPGLLSVLGASAELDRPGIVYDALGLPGSTVFTIAGYDRDGLTTQLAARRPNLYVLWYGTNESALPDLDIDEMKRAYQRLFVSLKAAAPQADCLLISPTDRQARLSDGTWGPARSQEAVVSVIGDIAQEHGCAIWSARDAMGGPGSMHAWRTNQPRLAHPDHVHLSPLGYTSLADAFIDDLLAAYDSVHGKDGG